MLGTACQFRRIHKESRIAAAEVYWVNYGDGMVKGRSVDLSDSVREAAA
jgi:hypothetical protein